MPGEVEIARCGQGAKWSCLLPPVERGDFGQLARMQANLSSQKSGPAQTRRAFKIHDVAAILGVSPSSVRRLVKRGELRPCRSLRHVLIPAAEVERFLSVR